MIADERRGLADEMEGWTEEQWTTPSLCGEWNVRQVAAHLVTPFTVAGPRFLIGIVTSGFNFDKANDRIARAEAEKPVAELIETLRANAEHRFTPPTLGPEAPLTDVIVHGQDMRRALGISHAFEEAPLVCSLGFVQNGARGFVPRSRVAGLRFEAADIDWSSGPTDGETITGTGEAVLLAITGRAAALDDLDGPGVETLRNRLG